jgi:hypothetical protein
MSSNRSALTNTSSYGGSSVTAYTQRAYRRTIEAITATPPTINTPRSAKRFVRWSFSCPKARIGMTKMKMSVRMFTEAIAKYVLGKSLHPFGKVGDQALHGSLPHSKALKSQFQYQGSGQQLCMTYIDKCDYDSLDSDERGHTINGIAKLGLGEDSMVEG